MLCSKCKKEIENKVSDNKVYKKRCNKCNKKIYTFVENFYTICPKCSEKYRICENCGISFVDDFFRFLEDRGNLRIIEILRNAGISKKQYVLLKNEQGSEETITKAIKYLKGKEIIG